MSWWRFWNKGDEEQPATSTRDEPSAERQPPAATATDPALARRLAELRRRRRDALFDVEQSETAAAQENPWQSRIVLLTEALATIEADRRALDALPPAPSFPLPPTPIADLHATADEPAEVAFTIGDRSFVFREETDWDQRGGPTVRGDLRRADGDPAALVPPETPSDRREALARHLADSLDVFATDLRDRALAGAPLPEAPTLADLGTPCPECGGWRDWRGRCAECAWRDLRRQTLRAEADRLEAERAAEAQDRHRLAERLPVARRRLAAIEADLAAQGGRASR